MNTGGAHRNRQGAGDRGRALVIVISVALAAGAAGVAGWYFWMRDGGGEPVVTVPEADLEGVQPRVAELIRNSRNAVLASPKDAMAWANLGGAYLAHNLDAHAAACFERACELDPEDIRWPYLLASSRELLGAEIDQVVALYERVLAKEPAYTPAHVNLGQALVRAGRLEDAAQSYQVALEQKPQWAVTQRAMGQVLVQLNRPEEALRYLNEANRLAPGDRGTLAALAQAHQQVGNAGVARQFATASAEASDVIEMPDSIRRFVADMAVSAQRCDERARSMMASGDYQGTIRNLRIVLETQPDDGGVYARLGEAYARLQRDDEAIPAWKKAIELKPEQPAVYRNLAFSSSRVGRHLDAVQYLAAGYQYAPDSEDYVLQLVAAYEEVNALPEAVNVLIGFTERNPDSENGQLRLADVLIKLGRIDEAMDRLRAVLAENPQNTNAHFGLGLAYERQQNVPRAVECYREALKVDPQHRARLRLRELGYRN